MTRHPRTVTGRWSWIAGAFAAIALLTACGQPTGGASNPPVASNPPAAGLTLEVRQDPALGAFVAGKDGKSLYVFLVDADGQSKCNDDCAGSWPPLVVGSASEVTAGSGVTGQLGTISRADGTTQVTLGGAPLYYFAGDSAAGDTEGQGLNDVWYLASPTGGQVGAAAESPGAEESGAAETCSPRYCY